MEEKKKITITNVEEYSKFVIISNNIWELAALASEVYSLMNIIVLTVSLLSTIKEVDIEYGEIDFQSEESDDQLSHLELESDLVNAERKY